MALNVISIRHLYARGSLSSGGKAMKKGDEASATRIPRSSALRPILIYIILGFLWITVSDSVVNFFVADVTVRENLQLFKGIFFVLATALAMHLLLKRGLATLTAQTTALGSSEARYRTLIEQASDGIFVADPEGKLVVANQSGCEMLGYTRDELVGLEIKDILAPGEAERNMANVPKLMSGQTVLTENKMRRKDGTIFDAEISTKLLTDGSYQGIVRDITDRKRTEYMVLAGERRYRTLVETITEGILQVNNDDVIEFANTRICAMLGYTRDELLGQRRIEMLVSEEDRETVAAKMNLRRQGIADRYEVRLRRKGGEDLWVEISGAPVYGTDGKVSGIIGVYTDITQRKAHERRLEEYAASQTELLGQVMSAQEAERHRLQVDLHDGPLQSLGVMLLTLDRLVKVAKRDGAAETALALQETRIGMVGIVNELRAVMADLSLDMLTHGGVASALRDHIGRFSDLTGISVTLHIGWDKGERLAPQIELLLYRLAQEALTNIRKHSYASQAEIRLRCVNDDVEMEIRDNGRGFNVEEALSRHRAGTGIGLRSMRQRITDAHGTLRIESSPGQGTSLLFRCPLPEPETA
jgi:two-component system, NarL family, sensor histidine kinase UhpB